MIILINRLKNLIITTVRLGIQNETRCLVLAKYSDICNGKFFFCKIQSFALQSIVIFISNVLLVLVSSVI